MKFLIMEPSPLPILIPLGAKYSPPDPVLKHPLLVGILLDHGYGVHFCCFLNNRTSNGIYIVIDLPLKALEVFFQSNGLFSPAPTHTGYGVYFVVLLDISCVDSVLCYTELLKCHIQIISVK